MPTTFLRLLTCALLLCSYEELQEMCRGVHAEHLFQHSREPFRGRLQHQNGTTTDVMIHWQNVAASPAGQESSRFTEWLDEMSQLQHPHVLPLVGACLDPPALVVPFMQVCFSPAWAAHDLSLVHDYVYEHTFAFFTNTVVYLNPVECCM